MKIRVLIVDDHRIFTDGMSALLQQVADLDVVGGANSADEALQKAKTLQPDVVLMDIQMPGKDGIETTREILKIYPAIKIIALTSANESLFIKKMLEAGASGYVLKNIDRDQLVTAIKKVHAGEKYLDPAATSELVNNYTAKTTTPNTLAGKLTKREKEILVHIAQGLTDKEIAEKVFLSDQTVITHRKNILSKLGLKNKVELTRFAMENGML